MPSELKRFHHSGQSHFVTFCCYHRRQLFLTDDSRLTFESALQRVRCSYRLHIYGYVVMPDHVHLLLSEPQTNGGTLKACPEPVEGPAFGLSGVTSWLDTPHEYTLADALKSLKQGVSRR